VEGQSLSEMVAAGRHLDQPAALKGSSAQSQMGCSISRRTWCPHTPLRPAISISAPMPHEDVEPRDRSFPISPRAPPRRCKRSAAAVMAVPPAGPDDHPGAMRALLGRTQQTHKPPLPSWKRCSPALKALEPKVGPVEAAKITAQEPRRRAGGGPRPARSNGAAFLHQRGARWFRSSCWRAFCRLVTFSLRSNERPARFSRSASRRGRVISGTGVTSSVTAGSLRSISTRSRRPVL